MILSKGDKIDAPVGDGDVFELRMYTVTVDKLDTDEELDKFRMVCEPTATVQQFFDNLEASGAIVRRELRHMWCLSDGDLTPKPERESSEALKALLDAFS